MVGCDLRSVRPQAHHPKLEVDSDTRASLHEHHRLLFAPTLLGRSVRLPISMPSPHMLFYLRSIPTGQGVYQ
jgi:hypothetical protein